MNTRERYEWTPEYCSLAKFDAVEFCARLNGSKVLFVGDSVINQQAVTLMSAVTSGGGDCAYNIIFGRNSELINPLSTHFRMDWMEFIHYTKAQIVIVGFGAHFHSVDSYLSAWETIGSMYLKDAELLRSRNVTIIFKTNNPGHLNCSNSLSPRLSPKFIDKHEHIDYYQWGLFPLFDSIGKSRARKYGFKIIDMYPLYLRPDGHPPDGDCLHYCMPGPLNFMNDVLLTMMRTKEIALQ